MIRKKERRARAASLGSGLASESGTAAQAVTTLMDNNMTNNPMEPKSF